MEDLITFPSSGNQIEGLLDQASETHAVIITHPHSLYGGDMYNSVVYMIHKTCKEAGLTTLRFNFRSVGNSTGQYDDGAGEQEDLEEAYNFLVSKGFQTIDLAGYSFGSWVGASLASKKDLFNTVTLVSPPVSFMDFDEIGEIPKLALAVVGDRDEFADLELLKTKMTQLNAGARLEILSGTDHFYSGSLEKLSTVLALAWTE